MALIKSQINIDKTKFEFVINILKSNTRFEFKYNKFELSANPKVKK